MLKLRMMGSAMNTESLLAELAGSSRVTLDQAALQELMAFAELVREEDTCISGMARILRLGETLLVQEQTPRGEVLVRTRPDLEAAEEFVRRRLEIYERMWDGCGCKVNYDDP